MEAAAVLEFWLGPEEGRNDPPQAIRKRWFEQSEPFDALIARELGPDVTRAARGEIDAWAESARGRLALIILLDQLTRNIHRGSGRMFEHDPKALALTKEGLARHHDRELKGAERQFLYMPLMHSEALEDQKRSVALFEALAHDAPALDSRTWARRHHDIVARFGRFPHRNLLLGRTSTGEEIEFLTQPGSGF
jgi:uncharacterized protein (DUF924 family)